MPTFGRRSLLQLGRVELIKTRRHPGFAIPAVLYVLLLCITRYWSYAADADHRRAGAVFPEDWAWLIGTTSAAAAAALIILVTLLVAHEQTWRTDRQNVIDGLSRTQYFTGKLLLCTTLCVAVWAVTIGGLLVFAEFEMKLPLRDPNVVQGQLLDATAYSMMLGLLLRLLVITTVALLLAVVTSDSGAALAFSLGFVFLMGPLETMLGSFGATSRAMASWLPDHIVDNLLKSFSYDATQLARMNLEVATLAAKYPDRAVPGTLHWHAGSTAMLAAAGYAALFSTLAWIRLKKRDL